TRDHPFLDGVRQDRLQEAVAAPHGVRPDTCLTELPDPALHVAPYDPADRDAPEPREEVLADAALVGQEGGATCIQPGRKPSGRQGAELGSRGGRVDPRTPVYGPPSPWSGMPRCPPCG